MACGTCNGIGAIDDARGAVMMCPACRGVSLRVGDRVDTGPRGSGVVTRLRGSFAVVDLDNGDRDTFYLSLLREAADE